MNSLRFGLILAIILLAMRASHAADCGIQQLTQGATYHAPQVDGHWALWSGYETDAQNQMIRGVWLVDLATPAEIIRVTNQLAPDTTPQINDGQIVWVGEERLEHEIFRYQIDTGSTMQITTNNAYEVSPQLHNGQIVWASAAGAFVLLYSGEIVLYDHATGITTQITTSEEGNFNPQIHAGRIVWIGAERGEPRLLLYADGETSVISTQVDLESAPQINGQWVVWTVGNENRRRDLRVYDWVTQTETELSAQVSVTAPALDGGHIVWTAIAGDDWDIFYYDGTAVRQISANDENDMSPFINGDAIVWTGSIDGAFNIFRYQISTGVTTQITHSDYNFAPQISGDWVVWLGNVDTHGGDIFLYHCA